MLLRVKLLFDKIADNKSAHRLLLISSFIALFVSSCYIGFRSAEINNYNIDQLIDGFMFGSYQEFQGAVFPASHTFLIKWPVFAALGLFGNTPGAFTGMTVSLYVFTVMAFAALLVWWTRQNLLASSVLVVALTAVLCLIPAQSDPGIQAPLNMAMVTTRNIEYLWYIGFLVLLVRLPKLISWKAMLTLIAIVLLGVTDHLYILYACLAAVLHIAYQVLYKKQKLSLPVITPLIVTAAAYVIVSLTSIAINLLNITNIYQPTGSAPVNITSSIWKSLESSAWAVQALLENFGVNVFNREISSQILPYLINGLIFLFAMAAIYKMYIARHTASASGDKASDTTPYDVGYWLFLTLAASLLIYLASNHNIVDDLRYVGISLFAGFVALCVWLNRIGADIPVRDFNRKLLVVFASLAILSPLYGLSAREGLNADYDQTKVYFESRINSISSILAKNDVEVFVGDYYVVAPVRLRMENKIAMTPTLDEGCLLRVNYLTSEEWYKSDAPQSPDATSALLLRTDPDTQPGNRCTTKQLVDKLGNYDKKIPLGKGSSESLLIYDRDIRGRF